MIVINTWLDCFVSVDVPEQDVCWTVSVKNAEDEKHARLAAYYHVYGDNEQPSWNRVRELTHIKDFNGTVDAKMYVNHFKEVDNQS